MNYQSSIQAINIAQAHYFALCDLAETEYALIEALETLWRLKAHHKTQFGTLTRSQGEWI
jgi:hypothetical protein